MSHRFDRGFRNVTGMKGDDQVSLVRAMLILLVSAAVLAAGTTCYSFASAGSRKRIENRLHHGVEKFAGRYQRFEQWETATSLYLRVHARAPQRNSILRKLADCYNQLGDRQNFEHYNTLALQNDLERFKSKPDSISLNQSFVRTYRQKGDLERADYHLQRALRIALERVAKKPESASAAYWLGRTYQLQGNYRKALDQFKNACRLSPATLKYQKAYYRLKNDPSVKER